ncbi:MAG: hypothetical protein NXH82_08325 [Rhodobacteraceae bacterium]|nr:hypothetical protein [Paracoccaceae bacterium]
MSDIDELQRRITSAMARISAGVETLAEPAPAADPALLEAAEQRAAEAGARAEASEVALEEERLANAQLSERLNGVKSRHEAETGALRQQMQAQGAAMKQLDADLQELRAANEGLRASNAALREANAEGLADAALIDAALKAENESLRSARAADMSEAGAIMAQLGPLLAAARSLPEGEET